MHQPQAPVAHAHSGAGAAISFGPQKRTHARAAGCVVSEAAGQQRRVTVASRGESADVAAALRTRAPMSNL